MEQFKVSLARVRSFSSRAIRASIARGRRSATWNARLDAIVVVFDGGRVVVGRRRLRRPLRANTEIQSRLAVNESTQTSDATKVAPGAGNEAANQTCSAAVRGAGGVVTSVPSALSIRSAVESLVVSAGVASSSS